MKLTEKQKKFIDFYLQTGNATKSCKLAGYNGDNLDRIGYENLRKLESYIKPRLEKIDNTLLATTQEILVFWSKSMTDENFKPLERLKASELLAKALGMFVQKVEVKQVDTEWFI